MKLVTAAILVKDKKILIAKRPADDKLAGNWEFPGGTIKDDEIQKECLKREMHEEFGIDVEVGTFFDSSIYEYDHGEIILLAYWVKWLSGDIELKAHSEIAWVTPAEMRNYDFAPADIPFVLKLQAEFPGGL